jgi:hypothetical protein
VVVAVQPIELVELAAVKACLERPGQILVIAHRDVGNSFRVVENIRPIASPRFHGGVYVSISPLEAEQKTLEGEVARAMALLVDLTTEAFPAWADTPVGRALVEAYGGMKTTAVLPLPSSTLDA